MRIVIIGAGEVGYHIAKTLSLENHEVTVVERDEKTCQYVQSTLDVLTISGNGANISTLKEAGIQDTDMIVAVTGIDEVNMVACMTARQFGVSKKIARIRDVEYIKNSTLIKQQLGVDFVINPEIATSREIVNLLESPVNVAQIQNFAEGKVQIFELKVKEDFPFIGRQLKDINLGRPTLIVAIYRKGEIVIPSGEEKILLEDNLYIVAGEEHFLKLDEITGPHPVNIRNVMILGGSNIGIQTASILSRHGISTKLIEANREKCHILAQKLPDTLVINGDGTDVEILKSEGIGATDGFVAVTGDEETNILVSLLAKHLGSNKVIAKVDRSNYIPIVEKIGVDAVVDPRIITTSSILRFIRKGEVVSLTLLKEGKAEIMELIAQPASKIINKPLRDAHLPKECIIGAIVRGSQVIIPHGNDIIQPQDKVIVFTLPSSIKKIERMFTGKQKVK
ncbi:Trk system potassium transporter TrkA [Candidatus Aerophobetes bacterium]|uniref:Trk system potassium uptake protein TrkA n=1 Tax=Aerophobetes bacterium TaxID=2030807 RepID=A0A662D8K1_UNCAE|nr:MAG: Trk system potassium transporter TrkA [Candidatus Aerophobetes bacterium]